MSEETEDNEEKKVSSQKNRENLIFFKKGVDKE